MGVRGFFPLCAPVKTMPGTSLAGIRKIPYARETSLVHGLRQSSVHIKNKTRVELRKMAIGEGNPSLSL